MTFARPAGILHARRHPPGINNLIVKRDCLRTLFITAYPGMTPSPNIVSEKHDRLRKILREMESVLAAYSGGVDSTFLLKVARDVLGDRAVAVIASSEIYPPGEIEAAENLARNIGARLISIHTDERQNHDFTRNAPDRCYHCKTELFGKLKRIAAEEGLGCVVHGANADDLEDYRPGQKAAEELGIRAPLQEAGFTKSEIRELSRQLGLSNWDKPSLACLASRIPYGTPIAAETLRQIGEAEKLLRELGFRQVRVRHHGSIARIEIEPEELSRLLETNLRKKIVERLKELGYLYVTVDIEGYRTGSMNAMLNIERPTSNIEL